MLRIDMSQAAGADRDLTPNYCGGQNILAAQSYSGLPP